MENRDLDGITDQLSPKAIVNKFRWSGKQDSESANTSGTKPASSFDYFKSAISNSIFTSFFTLTVPPATVTGVIPKSVCFRVTDPR
jgi:hypothetical protein